MLIGAELYWIDRNPHPGEWHRASFQVRKEGNPKPYHVWANHAGGQGCTCEAGKRGRLCRHVKALREVGLLEDPEPKKDAAPATQPETIPW
jgi:hypothetical protein